MATITPQSVLCATKWSGLGCLLLVLSFSLTVTGCGGGSSSSGVNTGITGYSLHNGIAEKGPFISGSTVTAQELDQNLSPVGEQFVYKVNTDIGTYISKNTFNSRYISLSVNGYFFDEVNNEISNDAVTLNAYGDLAANTFVNVNLLTTLAYQRIQTLIVQSALDYQSARVRAQKEVLAAFHIRPLADGLDFNHLDLKRQRESDYVLLAISSIFLQAGLSENLSQLITDFQSDIADNGLIDNSNIKQSIASASQSLDTSAVAANITAKFKSLVTLQNNFLAKDIAQWIDQDGNGLIEKYEFVTKNALASAGYLSPAYIADSDDDLGKISSSAGTVMINGSAVPNGTLVHVGDHLTLSLISEPLPNDAVTGQIMIDNAPVSQFTVITAPTPVSVAAEINAVGTPSKLALSADDLTLYIASMPTTKSNGTQINDGGLYVYDITDLSTPTNLKLVQFPLGGFLTGYYGVAISADGISAYVASSQQELQIIDLTYLNSPALISRTATNGLATSIVESSGLSSVFVGTSGKRVQQFNISLPSNPLLTDSEVTEFRPWGLSISPDDTQLVGFSSKEPGTDLIDLTTSTKVASSNVTSAAYCGNQQLFSVGSSGDQLIFEIIELSNPTAPISLGLGTADLPSAYDGSGIGVSVNQNLHMAYIVVQGEVFLIDLSDLSKPVVRGSIILPSNKNASTLLLNPNIVPSSDGKHIYVSWRSVVYGLQVGD